MNKYQRGKARAIAAAIDCHLSLYERAISWQELAQEGARFEKLGKRYGLLKEFRESGII